MGILEAANHRGDNLMEIDVDPETAAAINRQSYFNVSVGNMWMGDADIEDLPGRLEDSLPGPFDG